MRLLFFDRVTTAAVQAVWR